MAKKNITEFVELVDETPEEKYSNVEKRMTNSYTSEEGKLYLELAIKKFKEAMKYKGMSQDDLAKELGVQQSTISQWFSCKRKLPPNARDDILDALGVCDEYIRDENMAPQRGMDLLKAQQLSFIQSHVVDAMDELVDFSEDNYPDSTTCILLSMRNALFEYIKTMREDFEK